MFGFVDDIQSQLSFASFGVWSVAGITAIGQNRFDLPVEVNFLCVNGCRQNQVGKQPEVYEAIRQVLSFEIERWNPANESLYLFMSSTDEIRPLLAMR